VYFLELVLKNSWDGVSLQAFQKLREHIRAVFKTGRFQLIVEISEPQMKFKSCLFNLKKFDKIIRQLKISGSSTYSGLFKHIPFSPF